MISLVQILNEMAAPREIDLARDYYHGTGRKEAAESIITNGIQPSSLAIEPTKEILKTQYKGVFIPIENMVYLTRSLETAIRYSMDAPYNEDAVYVFVVSGKELKDIQPDEDSVGEFFSAMYNAYNFWQRPDRLPERLKKIMWLYNIGIEALRSYPNVKRKIYDSTQKTKAGKIILPYLTDKQKLQIIGVGAHIAHAGPLFPKELWIASKGKIWLNPKSFPKIAKKIKL